MVEFKHTDYTTAKGVLVFPDHYVSVAHTFKKDDSAAVTQDGRKIVKAGTLYPSNDASAIGIVWADYDVTDGDRTGALIIHGFVKTKALPVIPSSTAKGALKMIQFLPLEAVTPTMTAQGIRLPPARPWVLSTRFESISKVSTSVTLPRLSATGLLPVNPPLRSRLRASSLVLTVPTLCST